MMFCLDDGAELVYGPATTSVSEPGSVATRFPAVEPQTAILHSTDAPGEAATLAQVDTTDQTAILSTGAKAERRGSLGGLSEKGKFSAKSLAALLVAVVILVGGIFLDTHTCHLPDRSSDRGNAFC